MPVSQNTFVYRKFIQWLGRDRLAYLTSNTLNAVTTNLSPFLWTLECKAIVLTIRPETTDTVSVELLPNQNFSSPRPGQHIEIAVDLKNSGEITKRCYSITHASPESITITVKRKRGGEVSQWIHRCLQPGALLTISAPRGQFTYQEQPRVKMICAGSGITPVFALLQQIERQRNSLTQGPDVRLFYRSQRPENTIFLSALQRHIQAPQYHFSYSQGDDAVPHDTLTDELRRHCPISPEDTVYLCGPASFRNAVLHYLRTIDFDLNRVILENFGPMTAGNEQSTEGAYTGQSTVTLGSRNLSFTLDSSEQTLTLLEAAEAAGINLEHGCRSGMCGTCKTRLVEGRVTGNQLGDHIYPCTSYAASPQIVLE